MMAPDDVMAPDGVMAQDGVMLPDVMYTRFFIFSDIV